MPIPFDLCNAKNKERIRNNYHTQNEKNNNKKRTVILFAEFYVFDIYV